jgi:hypothetical protein
MTRPYFSRDRISHFDNFARHSDTAITKILSRLAEPQTSRASAIDFQDIVARFTLDSGTEFLFNRDVCSLNAPLPYPGEKPRDDSASFAAAFGRAQEMLIYRLGLDKFWAWAELFWDRTKADMEVIDAYVTPILRQKVAEKSLQAKSACADGNEKLEEEGDTLLDHLVQHTDGKRALYESTRY